MPKKTTIVDVAKAAEVSIATVSRVLNSPDTVREATRRRVEKALADTGYFMEEPSEKPAAQVREPEEEKKKKIILIALPSIKHFLYMDIVDGIRATASLEGYDTTLYLIRGHRYSFIHMKELVDTLNVCGVVMIGKMANAADLELLNEYIPVVQCSDYVENCNVPHVSIDHYAAARTALDLLIQKGCRKIAFINGPGQYHLSELRERAYRDILTENGLEVNERLIVHQALTAYELALSNAGQILRTEKDVDAFLTSSDVTGMAVVEAARTMGIRIPEGISVVAFDGTPISGWTRPALTVIQQPANLLGSYACEMLINVLRGEIVYNPRVTLSCELIIKGTT